MDQFTPLNPRYNRILTDREALPIGIVNEGPVDPAFVDFCEEQGRKLIADQSLDDPVKRDAFEHSCFRKTKEALQRRMG